jgi:outer membrane immunogenic protein
MVSIVKRPVVDTVTAVLLTTILVTPPAVAADMRMPVKAPPPPAAPAFSWSGCYIGAQVGGIAERARYDDANTDSNASYRSSGIIGGGHLGCNLQSGPWVFGIEGDGNGTNVKADDGGYAGATDTTEFNWTASLRGRLGIAINTTLLYAAGGLAFAGFEHRRTTPTRTESPSHTFTGWTVGGGIEQALSSNWSVRAEYRYTDYGAERVTYSTFANVLDVRAKTHQGIVGISYRFGGFGGPVVARY